jgi:1-acyl-sn-glycerol-3-phosphate acyltransferase
MANVLPWPARSVVTTTDGASPAPRQRPRSLYDVAKGLAIALFRVQNIRVRITGAENIPLTGGLVLAPNHRAYYDVIPVSLPLQLRGDRKPRYMLKKEAFINRAVSRLLVGLGGIAVDRAPGRGAGSYSAAVDALTSGEIVAVFPQGTIRHTREIGELRSGAVRMAAEADVPLVPVGCAGTQELWTRGRRPRLVGRRVTVHVVVGEPFRVTGSVEAANGELRDRLQTVKDAADAASGH